MPALITDTPAPYRSHTISLKAHHNQSIFSSNAIESVGAYRVSRKLDFDEKDLRPSRMFFIRGEFVARRRSDVVSSTRGKFESSTEG
jgi:hypothetical protein